MTSPISGTSSSSAQLIDSTTTQPTKKSKLSNIQTPSTVFPLRGIFTHTDLRKIVLKFNNSEDLFRARESSKILQQSVDNSEGRIEIAFQTNRAHVPINQLQKTILFKKLFKAPGPLSQAPLSPFDQASFSRFLRINPDLLKAITAGECEAESNCTQIINQPIVLSEFAQNARITGYKNNIENTNSYSIAFVQANLYQDQIVIIGSIRLEQMHQSTGAISIFRADSEDNEHPNSSYWFFNLDNFDLPHYLNTGEFSADAKGIKKTTFINPNQIEEWHDAVFDEDGDLIAGDITCKKVITNEIKHEWHNISISENGALQAGCTGNYLRINTTSGEILRNRAEVTFEENGRIREYNQA